MNEVKVKNNTQINMQYNKISTTSKLFYEQYVESSVT